MSLLEINQLSMNERVRKGHPGNMHLWWNRSPIESSKQLLRDIISGSAELAEAHDQEITENDDRLINKNITIVDPFTISLNNKYLSLTDFEFICSGF